MSTHTSSLDGLLGDIEALFPLSIDYIKQQLIHHVMNQLLLYVDVSNIVS
ncbi:MAG: hypothetical protein K2K95_07465 [Muribaculaceae bacterium]|nr:hypothetical protein [Muribaculaceae bacterium]